MVVFFHHCRTNYCSCVKLDGRIEILVRILFSRYVHYTFFFGGRKIDWLLIEFYICQIDFVVFIVAANFTTIVVFNWMKELKYFLNFCWVDVFTSNFLCWGRKIANWLIYYLMIYSNLEHTILVTFKYIGKKSWKNRDDLYYLAVKIEGKQ